MRDLHVVNDNTAWMVGDGGMIMKTVDGGANFLTIPSGTTASLKGLTLTGANTIWAVGSLGTVLHSPDGGESWSLDNSGTTSILDRAFFFSPSVGWIVGQGGTIRRTVNGGASFDSIPSGTDLWLHDIQFTDNNNGWIVGDGGLMLHSIDGGLQWTQIPVSAGWLSRILFVNANIGWAVGGSGTILHTTNAGAEWTNHDADVNFDLFGVSFLDELNGYAVGIDLRDYSSVILRTWTGGGEWTAIHRNRRRNACSQLISTARIRDGQWAKAGWCCISPAKVRCRIQTPAIYRQVFRFPFFPIRLIRRRRFRFH